MASGSNAPAFFDKTYNEALALTEEAHAFIAELHQNDAHADSPIDDLRIRGEAFRLTTRLMQVVAWLLTQRAVHAGELSAAEVTGSERHRLGAVRVCRDSSQHHHPAIPPAMADMLDRSLNLYIRVERLDELLHRSIH